MPLNAAVLNHKPMNGQHQVYATRLERQNVQFSGTGGISQNNQSAGFVPAFKNTGSGEACL